MSWLVTNSVDFCRTILMNEKVQNKARVANLVKELTEERERSDRCQEAFRASALTSVASLPFLFLALVRSRQFLPIVA